MLAAPSQDWNVFQQIFADHWEPFQRAHPRYQTAYYDGLVAKMLACGNPEKMGYIEYRCLQCGQGKHLVAMSCKSSFSATKIKQVSSAVNSMSYLRERRTHHSGRMWYKTPNTHPNLDF